MSALLRTRIDQGVPQGRFLDPTTTVGLQAPTSLLAPSGYSIGSSKARRFTNTAEVYAAANDRIEGLYHVANPDARRAKAAFSHCWPGLRNGSTMTPGITFVTRFITPPTSRLGRNNSCPPSQSCLVFC